MRYKCQEQNEPCSGKYYIHRTANGGKCARSWCERCLRNPPQSIMKSFAPLGDFFAHEVARMCEFSEVATPEALNNKPCAKCGVLGPTESHHWAPRHLFGAAADDWPTSDLCSACHKRWHEVVTPKMSHQRGIGWGLTEPNQNK
jgi:hypothetical protein